MILCDRSEPDNISVMYDTERVSWREVDQLQGLFLATENS